MISKTVAFLPFPIAGGLLLAAGAVNAQLATAPDDPVELDSINVTGVRASIQQSLLEKHSATGIVDAISAEDIGKFPDLNLSESLQRIPGITVDRNNIGEGSTINLRGLGPAFTQVEINGMPGMSNGGESRASYAEGSRGFNFEMFASELFSKAVVYKTGMAEVDEGGLAGTVRLETPRPLDGRAGARIVGTLLGNYSDTLGSTDPRGALLFSYNKDNIFGITASVAYSQTDFISNVVQASSWVPFAISDRTGIPPGSDPVHDERRAALAPFYGPRYHVFAQDRETTGSTLTLQFAPNERIRFTLDGLYGKLKSDKMNLHNSIAIESGISGIADAVIENGAITSGQFMGAQHIIQPTLIVSDEDYRQLVARLEWTPGEYWTIRPLLGYANREMNRTFDLYQFRQADSNAIFDPGTLTYQLRGDFIDFSSSTTDLSSNPDTFLFEALEMAPQYNRDNEKQARIEFERHFSATDHVLKFGLRYNERKMERAAGLVLLRRDPGLLPSALPSLESVYRLVDFNVPGARAPAQIFTVDRDLFREVFMPGGHARPGANLTEFTGTAANSSYTIEEKNRSLWVQMDLFWDRWTVIPGLRYVHTEQVTSGSRVENADFLEQKISPLQIGKSYNSWLPSLSIRYDLNNQVLFRAAYARSITRPNPRELMPGVTHSATVNGLGFLGNPSLEPFYAHNVDFGGEWYFSAEGALALNVFYKKIKNFIDTRVFPGDYSFPSRQEVGVRVDTRLNFIEPVNAVTADIKGLEISLQSRFSSLPGALGNFGGLLNYTHTESSADFGQEGDIRNEGLPGLSKNSANATLYYDDGRFDARLAYAWRDRYIAQFGDLGGVPRFTKAYGQFDLSLHYQLTEKFSIQAQVLNLTNEQRIDQSTTRYLPFAVSTIDRRILLGIRVAF